MKTNGIKLTAFLVLLAWRCLLCEGGTSYGHVYQDFDSLPPTGRMEIPRSGGTWKYASGRTNMNNEIKTCGWYSSEGYQGHRKIYDFFKYYRNTYNTPNMGFETYGFLEIDSTAAVKGNSLRVTVTGGRNSEGEIGRPVFSKEDYLDSLHTQVGNETVATKIGHPYIYFCNNSSSQRPIPFPYVKGCNRLSLYVRVPAAVTNGPGGSGNPPQATIDVGPYNSIGGHWYHHFYNQGGGWTHLLVDGHPQHNNAWHSQAAYPYPSWSLRDMDTVYFSTMYRWYITFLPTSGIAVPPYHVWIDEIEVYHDPEPQNNETINSPAITFHPHSGIFEVGFNDKYKNNGDSKSNYEIRYSFSPITNSNFDQALPALIQPDHRFAITENMNGGFIKWQPYYQAVWARFRLKSQDEHSLKPGTRIFFAIKDRSVRPYHLDTFDRDGDTERVVEMGGKRRIDLIKKIDFLIGQNYTPERPSTGTEPQRVKNLRVSH